MSRGGSSGPISKDSSTNSPLRQGSISLGFSPAAFEPIGARNISSEEPFALSTVTSRVALINSGALGVDLAYDKNMRSNATSIERHVLSLLRKLSRENIHVISHDLADFIKNSAIDEELRKGNMKRIVNVIFEKATDHIPRSTIYAALCKGIMDRGSSGRAVPLQPANVVVQLPSGWIFLVFRKHLLDICHQVFEQSFGNFGMLNASSEQKTNSECIYGNIPEMDFEAVYTILKARRQALGGVKFMAELYKTKILPEETIQGCANTLLESLIDPEEQRIETLSILLTTVGNRLEAEDAPIHLDKWFATMKELILNPTISLRANRILITLIKCREGGWEIPKKVIPLSETPLPHLESYTQFDTGDSVFEASVNKRDIYGRARIIDDITQVNYPSGIKGPRPELNRNAEAGKFRYDREFLLQFIGFCNEMPATLPPLDALSLEPRLIPKVRSPRKGKKSAARLV